MKGGVLPPRDEVILRLHFAISRAGLVAQHLLMKNIQVIDGADNCVYDIFAATDEEFALIFPPGEDIAFIDEVYARQNITALDVAFSNIWGRRIPKIDVNGIHGVLFYQNEQKKVYYPTRRDEEAINPDGSKLRA